MAITLDGTSGVIVSGNTNTLSGITVGKGGGAVSTNTAVGASAMANMTSSGFFDVAIGYNALYTSTGGIANNAIGYRAMYATTTGANSQALGASALAANTTGSFLVAVGDSALAANTTGNNSIAIGQSALQANTTASNNVAVGYQAAYSTTTGDRIVAVGKGALYTNTTGAYSVAVGTNALNAAATAQFNTAVGDYALQVTTGSQNTGVGAGVLYNNTSGAYNTAVGYETAKTNTTGQVTAVGWRALQGNTTGANNTAVGGREGSGYGTLHSNTTGSQNTAMGDGALALSTTASANTAIGYQSGFSATTGKYNTYVGSGSGYATTTGTQNTFVGATSDNWSCGGAVTTGSKNTIIGNYSGNNGGLDIRTASNYIVLSDGDGNPYAQCNASFWKFGIGGTGSAYGGGSVSLNGSTASGYQPSIGGYGNGTAYWTIGTKGAIDGSSSTFLQCQNTGGGVYLNGASATSWTAVSDERLKENLVDITDAAAKVSTLRAVVGNYTWDEEKSRKPFLIAQDVQAVLPEAVSTSRQIKGDETEYLGVSYTEVIPLLVAAIKEQQAIITTLTERITALEAK